MQLERTSNINVSFHEQQDFSGLSGIVSDWLIAAGALGLYTEIRNNNLDTFFTALFVSVVTYGVLIGNLKIEENANILETNYYRDTALDTQNSFGYANLI